MTTTIDLATPADVHDLVTGFYREIVFDELLDPVFDEVAEVDWADHIPKLIDYWCWILFGTGPNSASVTKVHRHLHELAPIGPDHCERWFTLWVATVDAGWSGRAPYRRVGVRRSRARTSAAAVPGPNAALYWPRHPSTQASARRMASSSGFESPSKRTVSRISMLSGCWWVSQERQTRVPSGEATKSLTYPSAWQSLVVGVEVTAL